MSSKKGSKTASSTNAASPANISKGASRSAIASPPSSSSSPPVFYASFHAPSSSATSSSSVSSPRYMNMTPLDMVALSLLPDDIAVVSVEQEQVDDDQETSNVPKISNRRPIYVGPVWPSSSSSISSSVVVAATSNSKGMMNTPPPPSSSSGRKGTTTTSSSVTTTPSRGSSSVPVPGNLRIVRIPLDSSFIATRATRSLSPPPPPPPTTTTTPVKGQQQSKLTTTPESLGLFQVYIDSLANVQAFLASAAAKRDNNVENDGVLGKQNEGGGRGGGRGEGEGEGDENSLSIHQLTSSSSSTTTTTTPASNWAIQLAHTVYVSCSSINDDITAMNNSFRPSHALLKVLRTSCIGMVLLPVAADGRGGGSSILFQDADDDNHTTISENDVMTTSSTSDINARPEQYVEKNKKSNSKNGQIVKLQPLGRPSSKGNTNNTTTSTTTGMPSQQVQPREYFYVDSTTKFVPISFAPPTTVTTATIKTPEILATPTPTPSALPSSTTTAATLGGLGAEYVQLKELIEGALFQPIMFTRLGLRPPRGALLAGPPGTGKTSLAKYLASQLHVSLFVVNGPEIMSGVVGESESKLRRIFTMAAQAAPSLIFLDEVDGLCPARGGGGGGGGGGEVEARVVATLLALMDGVGDGQGVLNNRSGGDKQNAEVAEKMLKEKENEERMKEGKTATFITASSMIASGNNTRTSIITRGNHDFSTPPPPPTSTSNNSNRIFVLGATNRASALDPALRRPGRFDSEINLGIPTARQRAEILEACLRLYPHSLSLTTMGEMQGEKKNNNKGSSSSSSNSNSNSNNSTATNAIAQIADILHGYVGADIAALCREAAMVALRRGIAEKAVLNEQRRESVSDVSKENTSMIDTITATLSSLHMEEKTTTTTAAAFPTSSSSQLPSPLPPPLPLLPITSSPKKSQLSITFADLKAATRVVQPSAMREVSVEVPRVSWDDIGGQEDVKARLKEAVEWPLSHPEAFTALGIRPPRGVLLFGPPGCSKTLMAKAMATEAKMNFIAVKGPELFSKYVGDSEKAVAEVFSRARAASPCVIFFDEFDSLAPQRGSGDDEGGGGGGPGVGTRVVSQLLQELDGVAAVKQVVVVAATNRPDLIDAALLRPGRIDRRLYVGLPDIPARAAIVRMQLQRIPHAVIGGGNAGNGGGAGAATEEEEDGFFTDHHRLAASDLVTTVLDGYTGAEIVGIFREAAVICVREVMRKAKAATASEELNNDAGTQNTSSATSSSSSVVVRAPPSSHSSPLMLRVSHVKAAAATIPKQVGPAMLRFYAAFARSD